MKKASLEDLMCSLPRSYKWELVLTEALVDLEGKTDSQGIMAFVLSMEKAFQKGEVPDLSLLSLKDASNLAAIFQIKEADFRKQLAEFIGRVKSIIIQCILSGMI